MLYVLATNNPGKAKEIKPLFEAAGLRLVTLADLGVGFEAGEDGETFFDNAMQKAKETAVFLRERAANGSLPLSVIPGLTQVASVLADDSGLAIDALGGAPGVHSALFMGRDTPYPIRCQALLDKLSHVPEESRTARFICNLVCLMPNDTFLKAEGTIEGRIAHKMHGEGGFGYDPIFYYPPYGKTLAQLTNNEKNQISHRGRAIQKMIGLILDADIGNKRLPRQD